MKEGPNIPKPKEIYVPKPREHLDLSVGGAASIIVCVGTSSQFAEDLAGIKKRFENSSGGVHNIDYYADSESLNEKNFLNTEGRGYVISTLDDFDKFSTQFYSCTGLVVAGVDKQTGKNISFLTHQNPHRFAQAGENSAFVAHLRQQLAEVVKRCVPKSIDAVIMGGEASKERTLGGISFKEVYKDSIELLSLVIKGSLGFEPLVVNGPKSEKMDFPKDALYFNNIHIMGDAVFYDNEHRRLYFVRPGIDHQAADFPASDVKSQI